MNGRSPGRRPSEASRPGDELVFDFGEPVHGYLALRGLAGGPRRLRLTFATESRVATNGSPPRTRVLLAKRQDYWSDSEARTFMQLLTLDAAKILGVDDRIGSLEANKDADILILDGDPLHYRTFVEVAIVNGKVVYEKSKEPFFSHIQRCGVLEAEDSERGEWMNDTVEYLGERYPDLNEEQLAELSAIGHRYCQPAIPHGANGSGDETEEA